VGRKAHSLVSEKGGRHDREKLLRIPRKYLYHHHNLVRRDSLLIGVTNRKGGRHLTNLQDNRLSPSPLSLDCAFGPRESGLGVAGVQELDI
jgi:hypothetical protein